MITVLMGRAGMQERKNTEMAWESSEGNKDDKERQRDENGRDCFTFFALLLLNQTRPILPLLMGRGR